MQPIEIVATVLGIISVYLVMKQNIWTWPVGIAMVILYIFIFFNAKLYSDMLLQIIYIFMQMYGWYFWVHGSEGADRVPVISLTSSKRLLWVGVIIVGTFAWGYFMNTFTDASMPFPDAFTTATSLVAQYLMSRKIWECWVLWIIVDIVSIGIFEMKQLYVTTILYAVFLCLASLGLLSWKKSLAAQQA